jgi:hypothetical protein
MMGLATLGGLGAFHVTVRTAEVVASASPLSIITLLVELVGVIGTAALAWTLRPPRPDDAGRADPSGAADATRRRRLGVVIVPTTRTGTPADPEVLLATRLAAAVIGEVVIADPPDPDGDPMRSLGWIDAVCDHDAPDVVVLRAGDIVVPDLADHVSPLLDAPDVGVIELTGAPDEHDDRLGPSWPRRLLTDGLSRRGRLVPSGSGMVVRRAVADEIRRRLRSTDEIGASRPSGPSRGPGARPIADQADPPGRTIRAWASGAAAPCGAMLGVAARRAGWRIVSSGTAALVARDAALAGSTPPGVIDDLRAADADAAAVVIASAIDAERPADCSVGERLDRLVWAAASLSGLRTTATVIVVAVWLLTGVAPAPVSWFSVASAVAWYGATAAWLWRVTSGAIRPGDRMRWGSRTIGSAWREATVPRDRSLGSVLGIHHGVAVTLAAGGLSVAVGLRGISDRATHTLAPMTDAATATALLVALALLATLLESMRVLGGSRSRRRHRRVAAAFPAEAFGHPVSVVDLTPYGVGVVANSSSPLAHVAIGGLIPLDLAVPTALGVTHDRVGVMVRSVVVDSGRGELAGRCRVGGSLVDIGTAMHEALVEFCVVEPALGRTRRVARSAGERPGGTGAVDGPAALATPEVAIDDPTQEPPPRRTGVRVVALIAVTGALASAAPGAVDAADGTVVEGSVVAVEPGPDLGGSVAPDPGVLIRTVCATDDGADDRWGTSDDTFTMPTSTSVTAGRPYRVRVGGGDAQVCWLRAAPTSGWMWAGETATGEVPLAPFVVRSDGGTVELAPLELRRTTSSVAPADGGDPSTGTVAIGTVAIGVRVFVDLDDDGRPGIGEPMLGGARVHVTDRTGAVVASGRTDARGIVALDVGTDPAGATTGPWHVHVGDAPPSAGTPRATVDRRAVATAGLLTGADLADIVFGTTQPIRPIESTLPGGLVDGDRDGDVPEGPTGAAATPTFVDVPIATSARPLVSSTRPDDTLRLLPPPTLPTDRPWAGPTTTSTSWALIVVMMAAVALGAAVVTGGAGGARRRVDWRCDDDDSDGDGDAGEPQSTSPDFAMR